MKSEIVLEQLADTIVILTAIFVIVRLVLSNSVPIVVISAGILLVILSVWLRKKYDFEMETIELEHQRDPRTIWANGMVDVSIIMLCLVIVIELLIEQSVNWFLVVFLLFVGLTISILLRFSELLPRPLHMPKERP